MEKQLSKMGLPFEFFDAVIGSSLSEEEILKYYDKEFYMNRPYYINEGMIGCTLSHYFIYQKIVNEKIPLTLILEDDMLLKKDLPEVLESLEKLVKGDEVIMLFYQSYDPINLSSHNVNDLPLKYKLYQVAEMQRLRSTAGYIISYEAAKSMLNNLLPYSSLPDAWKKYYDDGNINGIRVVYPLILENTYEPTTISPNVKGGVFVKNVIRLIEKYNLFPFYNILKWRRKRNIAKSQQCFIINEPPKDYRRNN